jgi:hypothetical protein
VEEIMIKNPVPWPDGAKCAVAITFDMDADSILHLHHPKTSISRISGLSMLRHRSAGALATCREDD